MNAVTENKKKHTSTPTKGVPPKSLTLRLRTSGTTTTTKTMTSEEEETTTSAGPGTNPPVVSGSYASQSNARPPRLGGSVPRGFGADWQGQGGEKGVVNLLEKDRNMEAPCK